MTTLEHIIDSVSINEIELKQLHQIKYPLSLQEEFVGMVARVESLRGRMGESTRQVEGLFESLLAQTMDKPRSTAYGQWSGSMVVVARVESLRGRMGESTRGVDGLFESLLAQSFDGGR